MIELIIIIECYLQQQNGKLANSLQCSLVLLLACVSHVTAVVVSGGRNIQYTEQQPAVAVFAAGTTVTTSGSETIGKPSFCRFRILTQPYLSPPMPHPKIYTYALLNSVFIVPSAS